MNKLTKVGCSALCGSLAAIAAANAGDLSATGSATVTFTSIEGEVSGNPIGMASNVTFKGSGELDNGWTYGLTIAHGDQNAYSATTIDIGMGGLGSLEFDQGNSGNGIAAYDNVLPTAWEEAHGAGLSGGVKTVLGVSQSDNIQYTTPQMLGTTIAVTYAHDVGSADTADKATGTAGVNNTTGSGYDITAKINPSLGTEILSGLNLYAGASVIEQFDNGNANEDKYEAVGAITYALGPVEVGAMWSGIYTGDDTTTTAYNSYKNHGFGVAFNVNDDFSISYGTYQTRKAGYNQSAIQSGPQSRLVEVESWQAAYTMGGASFAIADVRADNVLFVGTMDQKATIVKMGLAF
jgi:outer membrane protein OmpU